MVITRKLPPCFPDLLFEFADLLILFLPADRSYHGQESLVARTHRETFGRIVPVGPGEPKLSGSGRKPIQPARLAW